MYKDALHDSFHRNLLHWVSSRSGCIKRISMKIRYNIQNINQISRKKIISEQLKNCPAAAVTDSRQNISKTAASGT